MERVKITEEIKMNNVKNLEYASKEMSKLAKRLKGCNPDNVLDEDKLGSSIVEASVFINCFGVASAAFTRMVGELESGDLNGTVIDYLKREFDKFYSSAIANYNKQKEKEGGSENDNGN